MRQMSDSPRLISDMTKPQHLIHFQYINFIGFSFHRRANFGNLKRKFLTSRGSNKGNVVKRAHYAIFWINHCLVDKCSQKQIELTTNRDLFIG